MKARFHHVFLLILVGLLSGDAWADGKFYWAQDTMPPNVPYQRAFLLFDEGTETLAVQSKYELSQSAKTDSLAWVVPVPSPPDLAAVDTLTANFFFSHVSHLTRVRIRRVSNIFPLVSVAAFFVGIALMLLCLVQYPLIKRQKLPRATWERRGRRAVLTTLLGFLAVFITMPSLGTTRGGVEVVKAEQVGIYDVTVIRGESAAPVMTWLKESGFTFNEEDGTVFADYVARGWCFVTAKVDPNAGVEEQRITAQGLAAPLVMTFATDKPVYPLALTATAGAETEILICTLSPERLACGGRLQLRHAHRIASDKVTEQLKVTTGPYEYAPMEGLPNKPMMLCKFKGTMTAAQMREDLVFEAASDNAPYRETKWVW